MLARVLDISTAAGWADFVSLLSENQGNEILLDNLVRHLKELGAKTAIIENDYLDRDFTESFSQYYAKLFRRHTKICKRITIFSNNINLKTISGDSLALSEFIEEQGKSCFLGSIVLRPIKQAPISYAILRTPSPPENYEGYQLVQSKYYMHVLGAELSVVGIPMTQQDSRIGACAQASIWVAARHLHRRHKGPWISTANITKSATRYSASTINHSLPAGSEFLTLDNMVAALRSIGRETLIYACDNLEYPPKWDKVRPVDIINRYVDSGIPTIVILALSDTMDHAVVASGQVLKPSSEVGVAPANPTRAEFCEAFYVNDDQLGTNLRMPVQGKSTIGETPYNVENNVQYIMIPLPDKVYLPAEIAEELAWDIVYKYGVDWPNVLESKLNKDDQTIGLGKEFSTALRENDVFARTYLTHGWKYKYRAIRNNHTEIVKNVILNLELPRFVYVTEFCTKASISSVNKYQRTIFSHCVVDATAKPAEFESILFFHAPGHCFWHKTKQHNERIRYERVIKLVDNDTRYFPKLRGNNKFQEFHI